MKAVDLGYMDMGGGAVNICEGYTGLGELGIRTFKEVTRIHESR
jgi:hypothetical protein